ncbi:MAG: DUF692 domain-containing protein [Rhodospirillales bacterium]|nr:DUF692 domain-containing protein [Rhodospirillales bacterium]MBO6785208.1 DUF692 domain-containing protein [Rhodospirillales bacterium]
MAMNGIRTDRAGAGFKPMHFGAILETRPDVGFFEVHAENYMGAGGPPHAQLERLRADYPISVHGVGLSIGGAGPLDAVHLTRLKGVVDRYQPALVSEHLAWSTHQSGYLNDLLALPYTAETLAIVTEHVSQVQDVLGRKILLENPSTYITFAESTFDEVDFIREVQRRTGCGLLLDVNNVFVSAVNQGTRAADYIDRFPLAHVAQVHLAGHAPAEDENGNDYLIDAHDRAVPESVMSLFETAIARTGPVPSMIEWDNDVPAWPSMLAEIEKISVALRATSKKNELYDVA